MSDTTGTLTRLCALDQLFEATGSVTIMVKRGGKDTPLTLPIQAVDSELMQAICKKYQPPIKKERIFIKETRTYEYVLDTVDPIYVEKMGEFNRIQSYVLVLLALAIDVVDEDGQVVWSADNTKYDVEKARAVLRKMGFVDAQLLPIIRAVQDLTQVIEDEAAQD